MDDISSLAELSLLITTQMTLDLDQKIKYDNIMNRSNLSFAWPVVADAVREATAAGANFL